MTEEIKRIIKSLEGKVLAFGFKGEKFASILKSNSKIDMFDIFDGISKKSKKGKHRDKKIKITSLRKRYRKKKINAILIDTNVMNDYIDELISETIYIGNKVYLFGNQKMCYEYLKKYKRYLVKYEKKIYGENMIISIDIEKAKNNKIKENLYKLKDKFETIINFISDILTS